MFYAEVVELVDALDSKSSEGNLVRVRFPPSVHKLTQFIEWAFFMFKMEKTYYVYALSSSIKQYIYVGLTDDLDRRLAEHNRGYNKTTKPYAPFVLIYFEKATSRVEARVREKYLKSGVGKEFLKTFL